MRGKVVDDAPALVTLYFLGSLAQKNSGLHRFPQRINRWIGNLACIEKQLVEIDRYAFP